MNIRSNFLLLLCFVAISLCQAQGKAADSVVIRVGDASKVIFSIHDKADLETLKHYDFQALMNDMIVKLEKKDTTPLNKPSHNYLKDSLTQASAPADSLPKTTTESEEDWGRHKHHHWGTRRTYHSWNFDIGTNNYLEKGKFPDQTNALYSVKPWGSWYVGINSIFRTHITGKLFLEWGAGVSWYNFKFQNERVNISKDDKSVIFAEDTRDLDFQKSKLTATYVNASLVPVIDFGGNRKKAAFLDGNHSQSFRLGAGPYVGYRMDSYSKQMYISDGHKEKEHNHDSFYLDNIRYGMRLQIGFRDVDVFFNYDMNKLFVANKGPELNAFSFGVTF